MLTDSLIVFEIYTNLLFWHVNYRSEIDGLRALAVSLVVLYHYELLWLTGGYIGVDVFFVISGYLITKQLLGDFKSNTFNLLKFYQRRIARLFPALIFVQIIVGIFAWLTYLPGDLAGFGFESISASFSIANIYYYLKTGYFDVSSLEKLLLHTWSLSVEEQFYFIFPIAFYFSLRYLKYLHVLFLFAILLFASLLLSIYFLSSLKEAVFYLLPFRAWEILLGSLIALLGISERKNPVSWVASMSVFVGIAMIVLPAFLYDESTPFPGLSALAPCFGTAIILFYGSSIQGTLLHKTLCFNVVTYLGRISYSVYLWHWPLLVLLN